MAGKLDMNSTGIKRLVLFGAGMTGRGQVTQLAYEDGWHVTLIDKDEQLTDRLRRSGQYTVQLLGNNPREVIVKGYQIFHTSEAEAINEAVRHADLIVTSVLEPNLHDVAKILAPSLISRLQANILRPINIIAAENMGDSSTILRNYIWLYLPENIKQEIKNIVGFPNSMISRVVPISNDPLNIITEEYSEWTADRNICIGEPPVLEGLEWVENQTARLYRKLYIHNTGHFTCGALGWLENMQYIHEAAKNPGIMAHVKAAIAESGAAVSAEYGFSASNVLAYEEHLQTRLVIPALADDIRRVIRHPLRKLGKGERLLGPLLICEKHNLPRNELCYGVAAVMFGSYKSYGFYEYDNQAEDIRRVLEQVGPIQALNKLVDFQASTMTEKLIVNAYEDISMKYSHLRHQSQKYKSIRI